MEKRIVKKLKLRKEIKIAIVFLVTENGGYCYTIIFKIQITYKNR